MEINEALLRSEEKISLTLRGLYRKYGYSCFKMSKFEEYDLYSRHKDFLVSDGVITFNDTNGRLMALKPDVTLSIVKNYRGMPSVQRVYYNENVYRISDKTHVYKEIMQTGLECLGEITDYNLFEVLYLAALSLKTVSENCVLNISDTAIVSAALSGIKEKDELIDCISRKNTHETVSLCERLGIDGKRSRLLSALSSVYGEAQSVLSKVRELTDDTAILESLEELGRIADLIKEKAGIKINIDLSLINDVNYYNGLVFQGFVQGIPSTVLSGGRYDGLMKKMGKDAGGIGFAVYLDLLERLKISEPYDADVLLIYRAQDDAQKVAERVAELIVQGLSVSAQTEESTDLKCRRTEFFKGSEKEGETDG